MFRRCSIRGFPLLIFSLLANTRALQFHLSGDRIRFFPNIHAAPPGGARRLRCCCNTRPELCLPARDVVQYRCRVNNCPGLLERLPILCEDANHERDCSRLKSLMSWRSGARALAIASNRRLEDAVVDWIGRAVADPPLGSLPDGELLALCDATLDAPRQEELSALLAELREGTLATSQCGTARRTHGGVSTWPCPEGPRLDRGCGPRPSPSPGRSCRMILCPPTLCAVCAKPPRTDAWNAHWNGSGHPCARR